MQLLQARHAWPEKAGFNLNRTKGLDEYIFIHLWQPITVYIGNTRFDTRSNATFILDRNTPYRLYSPDFTLEHDWFHVIGDDIAPLVQARGLSFNTIYYPKNCGFITETVKALEAELMAQANFSDEVIAAELNVLFSLIGRNLLRQLDESEIDYKLERELKELRGSMFVELDKSWSVSDMARELGLSESRFYSVYKSAFKVTPNRDLITARIEHAKRLLEQDDTLPISELSVLCGYKNQFHFIRLFKRAVGCTPKKYALSVRGNR